MHKTQKLVVRRRYNLGDELEEGIAWWRGTEWSACPLYDGSSQPKVKGLAKRHGTESVLAYSTC